MFLSVLLLLTVAAHRAIANEPTCTTASCDETGKRIAAYMDEAPKYCEDFYQSTCGGFLKDNKIPVSDGGLYLQEKLEDDIINQVQNILEETPGPGGNLHTLVKNMYELCKKNDNDYNQIIETVRNNLQEVGDWPLFNENWDAKNWSFEETEIKLRNKGFHYGGLVKFRVVLDQTIPQRYILQILPAEYWMDFIIFYSEKKGYDVYKQRMIKTVKLLRNSEDETAASNYADTTLEIYTKLVEINEQNNNGDLQGKLFTLKDLSSVVPQIDWMKLLKGLMGGITEPKEEDEVYVRDLQYLQSIENFLDNHRKEAANVMLWQAVRKLTKIHGLPSKNSQPSNKQDDDDNDSEEVDRKGSLNLDNDEATIELHCSVDTYQKLPLAISHFYVKKHFPKTTREEATKLVEHIKEELLHNIDELQWMKDDTKPTTRELAKEKVKSMKIIVGHLDELEDVKQVELVYEGLKIDHNNYASANMAWNKWNTDLMFKRLRKLVEDTKFWDTSSVWMMRLYNPYDNSLTIPAGVIQPPYFSPDVPKYVNYAILGCIIGEHITKAIVSEGEHYDPTGHWFGQTWWSPETKKEQKKIEKCFQEVYSGYMSITGDQINSISTASNNMADQGALKLAYNAYKKHFPNEEEKLPHVPSLTTNQMFWLTGAHVWCSKLDDTDVLYMMNRYKVAPPDIRVNAAYGMMRHFQDDFGCKQQTEGQSSKPAHKNPLHPAEQCELW